MWAKHLIWQLVGFGEGRESGLWKQLKCLITKLQQWGGRSVFGWRFGGLKLPQSCLNKADPSGQFSSGLWEHTSSCDGEWGQSGGTALKEWKWPQRALLLRSLSLTHSIPCMFFPSSLPTKELSPLCLLPFLKESPGRSFQERNLIYFETRNKRLGMNVQKEPLSTSIIKGCEVILCVWIFEMKCCVWREPLGPLKESALTWMHWTKNMWEPPTHTFTTLWWV